LAGWLVDSDIEALLKNGPFGQQHGQTSMLDNLLGDDSRFAHLKNPDVAYQQLIGILGRPVIQANRLGTWLDSVLLWLNDFGHPDRALSFAQQ
jgi:hypothetical protein